jgi:group I intron endonuclease
MTQRCRLKPANGETHHHRAIPCYLERGVTGIYMITNKVSGHRYIGQSVDIRLRWIDHKTPSKVNKGTVLGRAFAKYGRSAFAMTVLERCHESDLDARETYHIAMLHPEYNMNGGGRGNTGRRPSEAMRQKLSSKGKEQWARLPEESKQRIIQHQLTGPAKGHPVLPITRAKLSHSAREQFANGMPPETRAKISQALKGQPRNPASGRRRKSSSVETIPQGSRAEDESPLEAHCIR